MQADWSSAFPKGTSKPVSKTNASNLPLEKKIMREVGKIIIGSKTRIDPELCVQKEKEGLFDMVAEEKAIA